VELSRVVAKDDIPAARDLLKKCLSVNPEYRPAIVALAETYRESNPEKAKKFDEMAKTIE